MKIAELEKYISKNSNTNSIYNALKIKPKYIGKGAKKLHFTYKSATSGSDYLISLECNSETVYESKCNCPYDHGGLCKHVIASVNFLIKSLKEKTNSNIFEDFPPENNTFINNEILLKPNEIILENDIIDIDKIAKKYQVYYFYETYHITSISKYEINTKNDEWRSNIQTLKYNPNNKTLATYCSCSKQSKICVHIIKALNKVVKTFGNNYFTSNYLENKIKNHLAQYNLSIDDEYEKIFQYELTPKGLKITSNYKNINTVIDKKESYYNNETTEVLAKLPYFKNVDKKQTTLAVVVEMHQKKFVQIYPIQGKTNKQKTDIASSLVEINANNINEMLLTFEEDFEQKTILKTLQINTLLKDYNRYKNIHYLNKAIHLFQESFAVYNESYIYSYNHKNSFVRKNLDFLRIDYKPINLFFTLNENEFFYTLKAKIKIGNDNFNINASKLIITPIFIILENVIYPINNADLAISIAHYKENQEANYFKKDFKKVYENVILPLSKKYEIETKILKKEKKNKTPIIEETNLSKQVYISDLEGEYILFKLCIQYPNKLIDVASNELLIQSIEENSIIYSDRNQSFEDNFIEEVRALHPAFATQENIFYLTPEQLFENYWMLHATDKMKQMGIEVFGANELKSFKFNINKPVISVNLKSDTDWFDIEIDVSFGNQKASLKELQKSFIKKTNYVTLGDGTLGILPEEWMKKFSGYFKAGEIKKNGIQISNYQFGIIDELYNEMESKPNFLVDLFEKKKRLQNISQIEEVAIPKGVKAKLRDYQHHGLNWLAFLDKNQLAGCLADDMGLGKTLQTITFLQYLKSQKKKNPPSLIIAPTSLIFNWKNEIEKFCPTLKMLTFIGNNRTENKDNFDKYDIIISTYGSLLNDIEFLKDFQFHYVILDESQAIKNPNSKRYKSVRLLNSYNRVVLTGTPIENNTFDLYAQLNFLNPGLLGNMTHFKNTFSDAIDKEKNIDSSQLLSKIISPFVLRRTKEQVATELPEKTESIIFCEMEKEQRKVYEAFKNKYRDYLLNKIDENGVAKSQMYILEGLTKLRQICNATSMINDKEDYGNYSVKLETLIENIKEKTGNHKILVFSQFVKMLQIIKTRLDEEQIQYEYLDGQTSSREEKVDNFQNNTNVRVFLISLKAGGTGLNLTEADYVFIIDPWWNPAVENQAIDRCYRIGQTKKVMAYRMICRDTIEEKIVALQSKKKAVASSIISIDEEKKSFDVNEVKELFS
jgi:SNF2 family DNA or RNA helicase/uncharacterized Zn finger protein